MKTLKKFYKIFKVWKVARPYLHQMIDEDEMQLIIAMDRQAWTVEQAAASMDIPKQDAFELLERCYSRCIVNKIEENGELLYQAADFEARLDHFAKYENWNDIPEEDRRAINERFLQSFIEKHRPSVERKMRGLEAENALPKDTIMLLDEVIEMIDAAETIVVQPCDCRRLGQNCTKPVETCIWLDDGAREALSRGHGREIKKSEAKRIVRFADKKGLMHTADSEWQTRGLHAICNCCACDCYPFRAAQALDSKGVWPKSQYIAVHYDDYCSLCGICVRRCHFGAFYYDGTTVEVNGREMKNVIFNPELCWGCGLCVNTCKSAAIEMVRI